ncbi:MAG TPA: thioredoxin family protein [bacterium]|nr:thioredoxin family protein [bacterium]
MRSSFIAACVLLLTATAFAGWESGASSYDSIKARAKTAGTPYIVLVRADWCPWCRKLDAFLDDNAIDALFRDKLAVKITPDNGDAEKRIAKDLGTKGFPSLFVILPNGSTQKLSLPLKGTNKEMLDALRAQLDALYKK